LISFRQIAGVIYSEQYTWIYMYDSTATGATDPFLPSDRLSRHVRYMNMSTNIKRCGLWFVDDCRR